MSALLQSLIAAVLLAAVPAIAAPVSQSTRVTASPQVPLNTSSDTTTQSPHTPYDCSAHSRSQTERARAVAAFKKGLSLITDLHDRSLRHLTVRQPRCCLLNPLSSLNSGDLLRHLGLRGMVESIAKVNGYAALVHTTLATSYSNDMQALYDILQGIAKEIYILLSPEYCTNCIAPIAPNQCPTAPSQCFTIPHLRINFFSSTCNMVSYISSSIFGEMTGVQRYTRSWLDSQVPSRLLPAISTQEWLAAHVQTNSPAHSILL